VENRIKLGELDRREVGLYTRRGRSHSSPGMWATERRRISM
jgi:hypothetical protein